MKETFCCSVSNPQSREREKQRETEGDRETERQRDRETERQRAEKDREYSPEPKSRVEADIAGVPGGLRGCESAKKPPLCPVFALKSHPRRPPATQAARADNASGIFSRIDSIHGGFRKTTTDIGS